MELRKHSPDSNGTELNTHTQTGINVLIPEITAQRVTNQPFTFFLLGFEPTFWEETHSKYSHVTKSEYIVFLNVNY